MIGGCLTSRCLRPGPPRLSGLVSHAVIENDSSCRFLHSQWKLVFRQAMASISSEDCDHPWHFVKRRSMYCDR
jgi:hypothetical protein